MEGIRKLKMNVSRGGPGGAILRAGATVELSEFWAKMFIADGTASEIVETGSDASAGDKSKTKSKKAKKQ